jgi:agmatinase
MPQPLDPNAPSAPDSGIFGLTYTEAEAAVVLLPVPWDVTTSYRPGTSGGPAAILAASRQIDLYDLDVERPYAAGIHMLPIPADVLAWNAEGRALAERVIAAGGVADTPELQSALGRVNELGERLDRRVAAEARRLRARGKLVGVVGGDHSVPLGAIAAAAEAHPGLGVLHVDAHADLRRAYEGFERSHASIMDNVLRRVPAVHRLVQVGIRDVCEEEIAAAAGHGERVRVFFDRDLARRRLEGEPFAAAAREVVAALPREVWVSFDIDGLDPRLCPHTGTPVPGGLDFAEAVYLLREVVRSGRTIVGFDLDEVAPGPGGDEWDGNIGARLLYKLIGLALASQGRARLL